MISARNQFKGEISSIKLFENIGEVKLLIKEKITIECIITREAAEELNLKIGDEVSALVKATEVMIKK